MRFCDKLANLRKKNNLTQENLADKLMVSRQAVSKWESGASVPDMEKIMELCKILNCNLDELVDDKAMNNNSTANKINSKFNINTYLNDILGFITKTYNMFCSMTFKEKIKCILELLFLIFIYWLLIVVLGNVLHDIYSQIMQFLPDGIYVFLNGLFHAVYLVVSLVFGFIVIIHLFKIRYLDYFVTVVDDSVEKPVVEKEIDENKTKVLKDNNKKVVFEQAKERVIIRDPKHSSYSFINGLLKLILIIVKCFLAFVGVMLIISLLGLSFVLLISAYYLANGTIFVGMFVTILAMLIINIIVLVIIYKIILNQKIHNFLPLIILLSLVVMGIGGGLCFISLSNFTYINSIEEINNPANETTVIEMSDSTVLKFLDYDNVNVVIDNSLKDIKVETKTPKYYTNKLILHYQTYHNEKYEVFYVNNYSNNMDNFKYIIQCLKEKQIYNSSIYTMTVHCSENTLKTLRNNLELINRY